MKPVPKLIEEIKGVLQKYDFIDNLFFQDDILSIDRKWFKEFAAQYGEKIAIPFSCNIHPNLIDEEICEIFAHMGCRSLQIGVESGSPRIRASVLNRMMTNESIKERVRIAQNYGIDIATFNMLGNYTETLDEMLETIKLNSELGAARNYSTIFIPYPGTDLNRQCLEENAFLAGKEPDIYPEYTEVPIIRNKHQTVDQVVFIKNFFGVLVGLYRFFPSSFLDRILKKRRFPFRTFNKLMKWLRPKLISLYLNVIVGIKNRF